jgi:hypothetical protein
MHLMYIRRGVQTSCSGICFFSITFPDSMFAHEKFARANAESPMFLAQLNILFQFILTILFVNIKSQIFMFDLYRLHFSKQIHPSFFKQFCVISAAIIYFCNCAYQFFMSFIEGSVFRVPFFAFSSIYKFWIGNQVF